MTPVVEDKPAPPIRCRRSRPHTAGGTAAGPEPEPVKPAPPPAPDPKAQEPAPQRRRGCGPVGDTLPKARNNRADLIVGGTLIFTDGLVAKGGIIAGGEAKLAGVRNISHGRLGEGLPIDFGAHSAALTQLATSLSQLPANGIIQIRERRDKRTQITLIGSDRQINIFALAGRDLATAQTRYFH